MELTRRQELVFGGVIFIFAALLILARLNSFGIWDPAELNIAEAASRLFSGKEIRSHVALSSYLIALSFELFGKSDWAGRLPAAFSGLAAVILTYFLARRFAGARAGIYAALVAVTTPLVLFNSRSMLGDAPAIAAQTAVALCATAALLGAGTGPKASWIATTAWLAATALATWLAIEVRGALLGALPPLAAVATFAALRGYLWQFRGFAQRAVTSLVVTGGAIVLIVLIALTLSQEVTEYNAWIGNASVRLQYPEFERVIESIFHAFAPWSALVPIALAYLFAPSAIETTTVAPAEDEPRPLDRARADHLSREGALRRITALWIFFGYGAHALFLSLGAEAAPFLPVAALAVSVALLFRSIERENQALAAAAVVGALLVGLIIRDYALYPASPLKALPQGHIDVPQVFNPKRYWAAILGVFAAATFFAMAVAPIRLPLRLAAPYRLLRKQWKRGLSYKAWLSAAALVLVALVALSIVSWIAPSALHLTTIATKGVRRAALVLLAVPLAVALLQLILFCVSRLRGARLVPLLGVGACFGAGVSHLYLPELSSHLSPRSVFESYQRFATASDELVEYRMGTRTASYYMPGQIREIVRQNDLQEYLLAKSRHFAVLPASELSAINNEFRKRSGKHLFVVDSRSARAVLVSNQGVGSLNNQNAIAQYVLKTPPPIAFPVHARFGEYIDLIGYNLALTHDDYVGAGESFTLTWYFRVLKRLPGGYKIFVHIDGYGLRINGDHDPVDGAYALNLWEKGDVIVDSQHLHVPAHFRSGQYTIFMGYFSGDTRLPVVEGPHDESNRVNAGILRVR